MISRPASRRPCQRAHAPAVPLRATEEVLTVREIAATRKVPSGTLYAMIERDHLAPFRLNNAIRARRCELQRFVREGAPNHS